MRTFRGALSAVLALTGLMVVPSATAAASSPTPYTAFALKDDSGRVLPAGSAAAYDETTASIFLLSDERNFIADVVSDNDRWSLYFSAPLGGVLAPGTYPAVKYPDETNARIDFFGNDSGSCQQPTGSVTIEEVSFSDQKIASLALRFSMACATPAPMIFGEFRFHSTHDISLVQSAPSKVDLGIVPIDSQGGVNTITLTETGNVPAVLGQLETVGPNPHAFEVVADGCSGHTLATGQSCTISVRGRPSSVGPQSAVIRLPNASLGIPAAVRLTVSGQRLNRGSYYPLPPSRILDTRIGLGTTGPAHTGTTVQLQVAGRGGVPSAGVSAVVLNVTVTQPTGFSYITVYPTGVARPTASSLNVVPGWTGANSVTVALGDGGKVDLFNSLGDTHLIADVVGYYALDNSLVPAVGFGGELQLAMPERLLDTRSDFGYRLPAGQHVSIPVSYGTHEVPGFYNPHIRALLVNITAVDAVGSGHLTAWARMHDRPNASVLNFSRGATVSNFAVVPTDLSTCIGCGPGLVPMISIFTSNDVHVIVDIVGFYDDGTLADGVHDGLRFSPQTPTRIVDTRESLGLPGLLGQQATGSVSLTSGPVGTEALALNVTAVAPTAPTFITVWPSGLGRPLVSTLNPAAGQIIPNAATTMLGVGGRFNVFNNAGSVHLVVDQVGAFYYLPDWWAAQGLAAAKSDMERALVPRRNGGRIRTALPPILADRAT